MTIISGNQTSTSHFVITVVNRPLLNIVSGIGMFQLEKMVFKVTYRFVVKDDQAEKSTRRPGLPGMNNAANCLCATL